jgi:hypothetical protein
VAHGLVAKDAQNRWRFICPRTWEGPDSPPALADETGTIFAAGNAGIFEIDLLGVPTQLPAAGINATSVRKMVLGRGAVFVLAGDFQNSVVAHFDTERMLPVLQASERIHSIAVDDNELYTATPTTGGVRVYQYELDGQAKRMDSVRYARSEGATISLEVSGGEVYSVFAHLSDWTLAKRTSNDNFTEIATSTNAIFGPVRTLDADVVVSGGKLYRIDGDRLVELDFSRTYTCVAGGTANAWACARTELYVLKPDGSPGERVFAMSEVQGPRLDHFGESEAFACRIEWEDFAREALLDPSIPGGGKEGGTGTDREEESGCSCTAGHVTNRPHSWLSLLVLNGMIFASRKRKPRR